MKIGGKQIGNDHPPYVIAEVGVNHDGSVERALDLTDAAADAEADAAKLQLFRTDLLMSGAAKLAAYQAAAGETDPLAMLRRLELSIDEMGQVVERAHARGIHAIVTVFSVELVAEAETLAWDAYKSASPDIVNRPLLQAMAATGRPLIVSTGASTMEEVERAVSWLSGSRDQLALLQCVSSYPAPSDEIEAIPSMAQATGLPIGYSDHTPAVETGAAAVSLGATVLEKHLTYSTKATGPDHAASLDPDALARYIALARAARSRPDATKGQKRVLDCERDVRAVSRQSLTTTRDLAAGHAITRDDVTIKRPGTGLEPWRLDEICGRTLARAVPADTPLTETDLAAARA